MIASYLVSRRQQFRRSSPDLDRHFAEMRAARHVGERRLGVGEANVLSTTGFIRLAAIASAIA